MLIIFYSIAPILCRSPHESGTGSSASASDSTLFGGSTHVACRQIFADFLFHSLPEVPAVEILKIMVRSGTFTIFSC